MSNFNSLSGFKAEGFVESSAQGKMLGSFTTMPTADASNVGATVLYQGATTVDYVQGSMYKCIMELVDGVNTYSWSKVNITSIPVESTIVQSGNPISSQAIYNADFASNSDLVSGLAGKIDKGTDAADIAAREAALESGITSSKVQQYDGYATGKFNVNDMYTTTGQGASAGISAQDPIAMKGWVNSSIGTNTANFRGSYSITGTGADGLGLSADATTAQVAAALDTKIGSAATNNDYAFAYLDAGSAGGVAKYDRYKYTGTYGSGGTWGYEYTLNNSSFTSEQWNAINSGINSTKVSTYDGYATGKQDTLVAGTNMDSTPTENSTYPVTSGGVYSAINTLSSNIYTKGQTDALLASKADKSTTYTKTEVDNALANKQDKLPTISGNAGKMLTVNADATNIEWTTPTKIRKIISMTNLSTIKDVIDLFVDLKVGDRLLIQQLKANNITIGFCECTKTINFGYQNSSATGIGTDASNNKYPLIYAYTNGIAPYIYLRFAYLNNGTEGILAFSPNDAITQCDISVIYYE